MTERTLAMVKSGAVRRGDAGRIIERARAAGLAVVHEEHVRLPRETAEEFYREHQGRPYFEGLIGSVTGPDGVLVAVLEGDGAIARWRELLGATDPSKAAAGSIRWEFAGAHGCQLPDNAAHGSDKPESAAREIALVAPGLA